MANGLLSKLMRPRAKSPTTPSVELPQNTNSLLTMALRRREKTKLSQSQSTDTAPRQRFTKNASVRNKIRSILG